MNEDKRSELLAAEAADWVIALRNADRPTKRAFAAWLRVSPEHIKEFLSVSAVWSTLPKLTSQPLPEELVRMATAQSNVVAMQRSERPSFNQRPRQDRSRHGWFGRAAAILVLVTATILLIFAPTEDLHFHTTATGQQSAVSLPDGSLVTLNTRSKIRVAYSETYREIHLIEGEALFEAAKDWSKPFRVITEQAVIEAVGTEFNVRADADAVTVTVVEGVVEMLFTNAAAGSDGQGQVDEPGSPPAVRLEFGQQARVRSGADEAMVADAAVERAISWRDQRLIFEALPLKQVIEEFNRYNEPPAIIADKELESLPISGVFESNDRQSFLQFLAQMKLAESSRRADGTIVLGAPDEEPAP